MWIKSKNILSPNYIIVEEKGTDLHFYVTGTNLSDVNNVSDAVEDLMNHGTKSKLLKKNIIMDELVLLENGVKVGIAGVVKKITKPIGFSEDVQVNEDRVQMLHNLINKF